MIDMKKTVSTLAIAAAAGLLAGSAQAADLGGNCCTDLEERVAELEATTVRKGNRKVSLQLYGQVSQSVIFWDDGGETNVYQLENDNIKNRLGVRGSAKIAGDWSAGYNIELQVRSGRSSQYNQLPLATTEGQSITVFNTRSVSLRMANWYINSAQYGRLTVGRQLDTTIGTASVNLVNPDGYAGPVGLSYAFQGLKLRRAGSVGNAGISTGAGAVNYHHHQFARNGATTNSHDYGPTLNGVKYTSPFFLGQTKSSGFQMSVGWGHDDTWGVALRYAEQFSSIRVAAAVGYMEQSGLDRGRCSNTGFGGGGATVSGVDCSSLQASASILHTPTGLYISGGWAETQDDNRQALVNAVRRAPVTGVDDTDSNWYIQAGWQAKLNALGNTIFWGQYYELDNGFAIDGNNVLVVNAVAGQGAAINASGGNTWATSFSQQAWGFGITQNIDAAAMALYMGYYNVSTDLKLMQTNRTNTNQGFVSPIDDVSLFFAGATIKF